MQYKQPDIQFFSELTDLNMDFLNLIAAHPSRDSRPVLGLGSPIVDSLRRLDGDQMRSIACAPRLLACFSSLPPEQLPGSVEEPTPGASPQESAWKDTASVFSAGLMTYLWQLSKQDHCTASLCIGPTPPRIREFARVRFREIRHQANHCVRYLLAYQCDQPNIWYDMIQSARGNDLESQYLSRLKLIPLGLAGARPASQAVPLRARSRS